MSAVVDYTQTIPEVVFLDCHACGAFWIQTRGEALAYPMQICRCLRCQTPYVLPEHRSDQCSLVPA